MKRLLIVGSDAFALRAMRFALNHIAGLNVFGVVHHQSEVGKAVARARPDVILIDGLSDHSRPLEALPEITAHTRSAMVLIVVSRHDCVNTARAMQHGAIVCVWPKAAAAAPPVEPAVPAPAVPERGASVTDLRPVHVAQDPPSPAHTPLTSRELETLRWVARGHTNAWIARKLWVTEQTVKFHLSNIYRKLGVANRTEAAHYASVHRLLDDPARVPAADAASDGTAANER